MNDLPMHLARFRSRPMTVSEKLRKSQKQSTANRKVPVTLAPLPEALRKGNPLGGIAQKKPDT